MSRFELTDKCLALSVEFVRVGWGSVWFGLFVLVECSQTLAGTLADLEDALCARVVHTDFTVRSRQNSDWMYV